MYTFRNSVGANLLENSTHGVPKHVGENVVHLLCLYTSACRFPFVSFTKFSIRELRFSRGYYQIYILLKYVTESFREQIPTFRSRHLRHFPLQLLTIKLQAVLLHAQ
jgi:hypothetical protein